MGAGVGEDSSLNATTERCKFTYYIFFFFCKLTNKSPAKNIISIYLRCTYV